MSDVLSLLARFVGDEILEGEDVGLDGQTPLLYLGVLNSIEMPRLLDFIERNFGVRVPSDAVVPSNFTNLAAIASLVERLRGETSEQSA